METKNKKLHYYVYFSSSGYKYRVDAIQFNKKSDIKNDFYKNKKYYSTVERAQAVADKLNKGLTQWQIEFARITQEYCSKIAKLQRENKISQYDYDALEALYRMGSYTEHSIMKDIVESYNK